MCYNSQTKPRSGILVAALVEVIFCSTIQKPNLQASLLLLSLVMLRYLLFYNAQSNFQASLLLLLSAGVDVIVVQGSSVLVAFARIWTCSFPLVSPGETQDCIKQKAEQNAERERDDQTLPFSELRDLLGYKHIRACKDTR